ncbi:Predicted oxidoreductase, contains short-chain dehydrogenase (SDR) and DUF2520 domains [Reichenbachiella agariperforans]|uniref:Predicted oxidoreductase, contains short-chain dehydrogenase (SDR) and DUF2520 domains n=1 Tax=Reichenbachiella agariperforans TaxID=156994 RepID=A0A1M6MZR6_REIAG|nr:Rossmann-like and DUF2520 domain-containing protein [Reichenbachiella agariperforans]SHJ88908.1 Predicted oxidoreductase, contains short-chain dehydrogenase (SDR) and DUF2520 domains [Reichenbachiella agariperforans]
MKIVLIGTGRVAQHLSSRLHQLGLLHCIYGRALAKAQAIATSHRGVTATDNLDFSQSSATIYLIAVSDSAIAPVAQQLKLPPNAIVAHCSGTTDLDALANHNFTGIFYPLQTFTESSTIDWPSLPILIEGSTAETTRALLSLGTKISSQAKAVDANGRKRLHVAAVFASNFTNRMLYAAQTILHASDLDLKILEPLVQSSIQNAFEQGTQNSLTGPAQREDHTTLAHHRALLSQNPKLLQIYELVTAYILDTKNS